MPFSSNSLSADTKSSFWKRGEITSHKQHFSSHETRGWFFRFLFRVKFHFHSLFPFLLWTVYCGCFVHLLAPEKKWLKYVFPPLKAQLYKCKSQVYSSLWILTVFKTTFLLEKELVCNCTLVVFSLNIKRELWMARLPLFICGIEYPWCLYYSEI